MMERGLVSAEDDLIQGAILSRALLHFTHDVILLLDSRLEHLEISFHVTPAVIARLIDITDGFRTGVSVLSVFHQLRRVVKTDSRHGGRGVAQNRVNPDECGGMLAD